jgi:hypothetical protein
MRQPRPALLVLVASVTLTVIACRESRAVVTFGRFETQSGGIGGTAVISRLSDGGLSLELALPLPAQPNLEVRLVSTRLPGGADGSDFLVVGRLASGQTIHKHLIPPGVDLGRYNAVCIWSRTARIGVATARLDGQLSRSTSK